MSISKTATCKYLFYILLFNVILQKLLITNINRFLYSITFLYLISLAIVFIDLFQIQVKFNKMDFNWVIVPGTTEYSSYKCVHILP